MAGASITIRLKAHSVGLTPPALPAALIQQVAVEGGTVTPLFSPQVRDFSAGLRTHHPDAPDLARYFRVESPAATANAAAAQILLAKLVDATSLVQVADAHYVTPVANPAWDWWRWRWWPWRWFSCCCRTDTLEPFQTYLDPSAADGVGARRAWRQPGGNGQGIWVADVEESWNPHHEDLPKVKQIGDSPPLAWDQYAWQHGTAVLGVLGARRNCRGMAGICHGSEFYFSSVKVPGVALPNEAEAIGRAAAFLRKGDVLLIEEEMPHPTLPQPGPGSGTARIPLEWWPHNFDAIKCATIKEILVVEPAGNTGVSLDDPILNNPLGNFGNEWKNPFPRPGDRDSQAVIIGAGFAPQQFATMAAWGASRSRDPMSNFGSCVDAQAWGGEIATCGRSETGVPPTWGSGDHHCYRNDFNGTSGASAIVAGVLACAQGMRLKVGEPLLTPVQARTKLRTCGKPQVPDMTERIGPLPNLEELPWVQTP